MSGCITCGSPTGRRQCKECAMLERVDEEFKAEQQKENTTDDDDSEATGVTLGPVDGRGTQKSYHTNCENCSEAIPAAARFCPDCGTEQTRAVEAIQRMRSDSSDVRTDGGPNADVSDNADARLGRGDEQYSEPLEAVDGMETVEIECTVGKQDLEECDGWKTQFDLKEPARYDGEHIHLPGFDWECPECGNPHNFAVEGIWVSNLV